MSLKSKVDLRITRCGCFVDEGDFHPDSGPYIGDSLIDVIFGRGLQPFTQWRVPPPK